MKQTDFILRGQERGYSKEEIADARDKFYAQGYSFDDDPKPQFTPHATLNDSLSESLDDKQNSLFDEHEKAKTTLHAFEGSKIGDTQQQIESGVKANTYDDMIRKERGLSEDEPIDYPTVLNEKKAQYTEEDDEYTVSNEDRYINANPEASKEVSKVANKGVNIYSFSLPLRQVVLKDYAQKALDGKNNDVEYDTFGQVVKGSGDNTGAFDYGLYQIDIDQRVALQSALNDKQQVFDLIREANEVQRTIGSAFDYSDLSYFNPKRAFRGALQSAPLQLELGVIATPYAIGSAITGASAPVTGGGGAVASTVIANSGRLATTAYLQQQGAGSMLRAYLEDKTIDQVSDEEFKRATQIANVAGVPYALIERIIGLPKFKGFDFEKITGGATNKRLLKFVMNKAMTDNKFFKLLTKGGTIGAYRVLGEALEEGLQEIVQESTGMTLEQMNPDVNLVEDIATGVGKQLNAETLGGLAKDGGEAFVQSIPQIIVSMGLPTTIETMQTDEFKAVADEVMLNVNQLEKDPVKRKANIKQELISRGVQEDLADELSEEAILAKSSEDINNVLVKVNSAVGELTDTNDKGIKVFAEDDWNELANMTDEDLTAYIENFPEIEDDFYKGINGDKKSRILYNSWAKNNKDTAYAEFLIRNKKTDNRFGISKIDWQSSIDTTFIRDVIYSNKYDNFIDTKYRKQGETLENAKRRFVIEKKQVRENAVNSQIARARKSLSRIAPNVKFVTYNTTQAFTKATGSTGAGFYKQGVVHVNLELANQRTVGHETFHALLASQFNTENTQKKLQQIFDVVQKSGNEELVRQINNFKNLYSDLSNEDQIEEAIAELAGILSSSYKNGLPTVRPLIYRMVRDLLSLVGVNIKENEEQEVLSFLDTVSRGFATGKVLNEKDIMFIVPNERDSNNKEYGKEQRKIYETEGKQVAPKKTKAPKKSIKAYKLFRIGEDNKLYPLYVYSKEAVPENEWVEAKVGEIDKKTGKVKGGEIKNLAMRAGWHATDEVTATQIGGKTERYGSIDYRKPNTVWAEVEISADVNYQEEANASKTRDLRDKLPKNGFYYFKTNPNATGNWVIGGKMKIVNRLSQTQKQVLYDNQGYADLPYLDELIIQNGLTFNTLTKVAQGILKKFYPNLHAEMQNNPDAKVLQAPTEPEIPYIDNYGIEDGKEQRVNTAVSYVSAEDKTIIGKSDVGLNRRAKPDAKIKARLEKNKKIFETAKEGTKRKQKAKETIENINTQLEVNVEAKESLIEILVYGLPTYIGQVYLDRREIELIGDRISKNETKLKNETNPAKAEKIKKNLDRDKKELPLLRARLQRYEDNPDLYDVPEVEKLLNKNIDIDERLEIMTEIIKGNLKYLYDSVPERIRKRSKLWYDGANAIAKTLAEQSGFSLAQVSAVLATQSPQKDWFQNIQQGANIIDVILNDSGTIFNEEDFKFGIEKFLNVDTKSEERKRRQMLPRLQGKSINELMRLPENTKQERERKEILVGALVRIISTERHGLEFDVVSPEGVALREQTKNNGENANHGWGSFAEIYDGVSVLFDGSMENISNSLGVGHKVRSFYNNIFDPTNSSDVTIDTHAFSAGLLTPHSANSFAVKQLFKSRFAFKENADERSQIVYAYMADIYRDLAKELGLKARELQSITWEKIRLLFPDDTKQSIIDDLNNRGKVDEWFDQRREDYLISRRGIGSEYEWVNVDLRANREGRGESRDIDGNVRGRLNYRKSSDSERLRPVVTVPIDLAENPTKQLELFPEETKQIIFDDGREQRTPDSEIDDIDFTFGGMADFGLNPEDFTNGGTSVNQLLQNAIDLFGRDADGVFRIDILAKNMLKEAVIILSNPDEARINATIQAGIGAVMGALRQTQKQLRKDLEQKRSTDNDELEATQAQLDNVSQRIDDLASAMIVIGSISGTTLITRRWLSGASNFEEIVRKAMSALGGSITQEDIDFINDTFRNIQEVEDEIDDVNDAVDTTVEDQVDEYVKDIYNQATQTGKKGEKFREKIAQGWEDISSKIGKVSAKIFSVFGGKEQKIADDRFKTGFLDLANYEGREDVFIARLAERIILNGVEDGIQVSIDDIVKGIQDVLGEDYTRQQILTAIANNTLPAFDLKKQYIAVLSLIKISANAETGVSKLAKELFNLSKKTTSIKTVNQFIAELDKLQETLETLSLSVTNIVTDQDLDIIRQKIQKLKNTTATFSKKNIPQGERQELVEEALAELDELKQMLRLQAEIKELQRIIDEEDYSTLLKPKKSRPKTLKILELTKKRNALKEKINTRLRKITQRSEKNKVGKPIKIAGKEYQLYKYQIADAIGFPRLALTMADMSAILRQGLILTPRYLPVLLAKNPAFRDKWNKSFMSFFSGTTAEEIDLFVREQARKYDLEALGLFLPEVGGGVRQGEEAFSSNLGDRIPVFREIRQMSERHYVGYINLLRVGVAVDFLERHQRTGVLSVEAQESFMNFINIATGRGDLGSLGRATDILSTVLFSPRFTASRIQVAPSSIYKYKKYPELRQDLMTTWLAFLGTGAVILALASLAGAEVEEDPEEADWGKIRIDDMRWDIWGGLQQPMRVIARAIKYGVDDDSVNRNFQNVATFFKYKLSPPFGITHELLYGEDWVTGEDISVPQAVGDALTPIILQTVRDAYMNELTLTEGAMLAIPEFFGIGSSVYQSNRRGGGSSGNLF